MDLRINTQLVIDALLMTLWKQKPAKGLDWHMDNGSHYASVSHRAILQNHHVKRSMSRKRNCWDYAVSDSFFLTLINERVHHEQFNTSYDAKQETFEKIVVFYNRERSHSAINY